MTSPERALTVLYLALIQRKVNNRELSSRLAELKFTPHVAELYDFHLALFAVIIIRKPDGIGVPPLWWVTVVVFVCRQADPSIARIEQAERIDGQ